MRLDKVQDKEVLRQAALLLERENERLTKKLLALQRELLQLKGADPSDLQLKIEKLQQELSTKNKLLFGPSSEKRSPETPAKPRAPARGHGPTEQPRLPSVDVTHELDEADCACPKCGGALAEMDGQFEESEEIGVVVKSYVIVKHRRKKYRCAGCQSHVETALGPVKLIAGGRYSLDFAIEVAIAKYLDHLPLERQARMMERDGLVVESQTLWDQIESLARILQPLHGRLHEHVLMQPVIGADETRWPLLDGKESKRWQAWTIAAPDAVSYRIEDSRSAEAAKSVLRNFAGVAMVDGYSVYDSLAKSSGFTTAHCWAHVRRKLLEVEPNFPIAKQALDLIGELYAVDQSCPAGALGDELRRKLRNERARPVIAKMQEWLLTTRALPESGLGKAIAYARGMWKGLTRFLEDPRIPLDNNATERAMRGPVIGRKNHYGSKSRRGTEVAALFYSLLETAKLHGIDPRTYLREQATATIQGGATQLPHEINAEAASAA